MDNYILEIPHNYTISEILQAMQSSEEFSSISEMVMSPDPEIISLGLSLLTTILKNE